MKGKKIVAIGLALVLALGMSACSGNVSSATDPIESGDVSQAPDASTSQVVDEATKNPVETEEGTGTEVDTEEPGETEEPGGVETPDGTETNSGVEETPKTEEGATSAPTEKPVETQKPAEVEKPVETQKPVEHTHNYGSGKVTKEATCDANGTRTYTCSCGDSYTESIKATGHTYDGGQVVKEATCAEAGSKMFTCTKCGAVYTEVIPANGNHNWATRHVDEVGHTESNGTHTVRHLVCGCGNFDVWSDDPDYDAKIIEHNHPLTGCNYGSTVWEVKKPNNPAWVVDIPAHDETYCSVCGITK